MDSVVAGGDYVRDESAQLGRAWARYNEGDAGEETSG